MQLCLKGLALADRPALATAWTEALGTPPPPNTSQDMMRLIVGWEVQAKGARQDVRRLEREVRRLLGAGFGSGGASSNAKHVVKNDLRPKERKPRITLSPGTRLAREWQGRTYTVDVLDKGFAYDGILYTSLSPIAKAITGSHRSGPHFFGVGR